MNILIIGSDTLDDASVNLIGKKLGQRVEVVSTGKDALDLFYDRVFDLVFVDLFLPDMNEYDLIPQIKRMMPDPKIITVTRHNTRELESRVREEGVAYYLIKPVDTKHLESIVRHIAKGLKR